MASRPGEDNTVPGLPEHWGRIVIPDDVSELDDLAEEVRAELGIDDEPSSACRQRRLPFIVIAVTVAIAMLSLFTVPWLGRVGQVTPPRPSTSTTVESGASGECAERDSCAPTTSVSVTRSR
ncbi:MAG: hypothetical protein ACRD0P_00695 [Stackebrandtia sp.]